MKKQQTEEKLSLKDKIKHTLEETRVVLPGTQALVGFQLVCVFSNGFEKVAPFLKYLHYLSLLLVVFSIIFLMSTASYHRIAEQGNDSDRLHIFGSNMLILGMILLLIGMILDIWIVGMILTKSYTMTTLGSGILLATALYTWYIYPFSKKKNTEES